jgi:hypothetical protein
MKLTVTFEMPLPEGFEPYLDIIAKTHGWSESSEQTAIDFVCENVCKPQVSSMFSAIIANAISGYLGLSGSEQVKEILATYHALHTVEAEIA